MKIYTNEPDIKTRKRFDELCNGKIFPFTNPIQFKEVFFPEFEDSLIVLQAPPPSTEADQYNCFAYALGVNSWVRTAVIGQAVKAGELMPTDNPQLQDIVIYYENGQNYMNIRHAGRYISTEKVASKWAGGPVFKHDIFMCPLTYGNKISYFKAVSKEEANKLINKYSHLND